LAILVACGSLGGLYAARDHLLPAAADWLDVGVQPRRADYVFVMPGDENVRPFVAAALVNAGLADRVLVPRAGSSPEVEDGIRPPADELICRVLVHRGVRPGRIAMIDKKTTSTYGDAGALAAFLESSPDARVSIVTSHYHTRRARWTFGRVLGGRRGQIDFVSAPTDVFQKESWWQVERGFVAVVSEYLKLISYGLRYGDLRPRLMVAAVLLIGGILYHRHRKVRRTREAGRVDD
jgi:uncharacterized SAM-binding protein YcdF (DUF218 family)